MARRAPAFAILMLSVAGPAVAGGVSPFRVLDISGCLPERMACVEPDEPLVAGRPTTALDLLREIYPGLGDDLTGDSFAGSDVIADATDEDAGEAEDRPIDLRTVGDLPGVALVADGATTYAAVLSAGYLVMAEVAPDYRPLGALFVRTDPGGYPDGHSAMLLAPGRPAVLIDNSHFNSQEGFSSYVLVGPDGKGALAALYEGPSLYSLGEGGKGCDSLDRRQELVAFAPGKGMRGGFADLEAKVAETTTCRRGDVETVRKRTEFPFRLKFDAAAGVYKGGSAALDRRNAAAFGIE